MKPPLLPLVLILLAACQRQEPAVQRIALDQATTVGLEEPIASPDTKNAVWTVSPDGRAAVFALPDQKPLLTLECRPPNLRIIRHVRSRPGESALFPVLGGPNARFKLTAAQVGTEWLWQGEVPLSDEQLDVFSSGRLEATLPGGGSLLMAASPVPGQLVSSCRTLAPKAPSSPPSSAAPAQ